MPPERITAKLLIVDAGPLITLAAAASLDYLLYANGAVIIPDAVFSRQRATPRVSVPASSSSG
jgi:hypothetical protein